MVYTTLRSSTSSPRYETKAEVFGVRCRWTARVWSRRATLATTSRPGRLVWRPGGERGELFPRLAPYSYNTGIAISPLFLELLQRLPGCFGVYRGVNTSQARHNGFSVFPAAEAHRGSQQVDDTGLHERLGPCGLDRVRESLQAVTAHDQRVLSGLGCVSRSNADSQYLAPSPPSPSHTPSTCLQPVHVHSNHHIRWAVDDSATGFRP